MHRSRPPPPGAPPCPTPLTSRAVARPSSTEASHRSARGACAAMTRATPCSLDTTRPTGAPCTPTGRRTRAERRQSCTPARQTRRVHIAQLNVGRLTAPMDDPRIDAFRLNLDPINALAEASPGFVWRLQDDAGNATAIKVFDDPLEIINLTVWTSIDELAEFTYRTAHRELLRRRREFFEVLDEAIVCLWWIDAGTIPTTADAVARLEHLRAHG